MIGEHKNDKERKEFKYNDSTVLCLPCHIERGGLQGNRHRHIPVRKRNNNPRSCALLPLTYLITDIVGEKWGKKSANRIVWIGLATQLLATFIIMVTQYMPTVSAETQKAYDMLLGQNWIFTLGSLTAYLISQSLDVSIFHKIRDTYIKKHGSTKGGRWIWNNASTLTSQLVDTAIFCVIAFGVGFGWLWDNPQAVVNMVIGQYLVKACIALLDTPFFYFSQKAFCGRRLL